MRGETKSEVCVIGLGYIGLPTAAIPAEVFVISVLAPFEKDGKQTSDVSYRIAAATSAAAVL